MDESGPSLAAIDRALISLRRFVVAPPMVGQHGDRVELSTLLVLDGLDPQGESVQDIAQRLDVAASTASRLVTRAAEAGMVTRTPARHDARETLVAPTPDGVDLPKRAAEHRLRHLADILDTWEAADIDVFANALTRFAAQATQPRTNPQGSNIGPVETLRAGSARTAIRCTPGRP